MAKRTVEINTYRKTALTKAVQVDSTKTCQELARIGWIDYWDTFIFMVATAEGRMTGRIGDYVAEDIDGNHYPIKADVFEQTYEEVAAPEA